MYPALPTDPKGHGRHPAQSGWRVALRRREVQAVLSVGGAIVTSSPRDREKERRKITSVPTLLLRFAVFTLVFGIGNHYLKALPFWECMIISAVFWGLALLIGAVCERLDWP
jgi:hypothetical protein